MRQNKFGNRKVNMFGRWFDSTLEGYRYAVLMEAQDKGVISDLECQKEFELIPKSVAPAVNSKGKKVNKVVERATKYRADFVYKKDGKVVVEDTKSVITRRKADYVMKRKLMLQVYGYAIREVLNAGEPV